MPTHKYSAAGFYLIDMTLTTSRGETKTTYNSVTLTNFTPPPAQIVASLNCSAYNMNVFCNAMGTYDLSGSPLTYTFDYGGFTDTNAFGASSFNYPGPGLYTVKLTVTNANGQQATAQTQVQTVLAVNQAPIANLGCFSSAPNILTCNSNASADFDGTIISYKYDWDDGASDVRGDNGAIIHIFQTSGSHQVTLTVIDNDGAQNSITNSFNVQTNNPPVAAMTCSTPGPQRISCYSNSYDPDVGDQIVEYKWDLGDGSVVTTMIPSIDYTYSAPSTYTVTLAVKDAMGSTGSVAQDVTVTVNQAPIANIYCFVTTGSTYQCNSNASDSDGQVVSQVWNINGSNMSGDSVVYNFTNGGDFPVTLIVTDDLGKSTSAITTIHIDKPAAILTCTNVTNYKVKCDASASLGASGGTQLGYTIIFGDDYLVNASIGEYEFQSSGDKIIKLLLQDDLGNKSQAEVMIKILPVYTSPKAFFTEVVELGRIVNFDASKSLLQDRTVTKYEWDFGDGTQGVSIDPKIAHSYQANTYYSVILKVTDSSGVQGTFTKQIFVNDPQVLDPGIQGKVDLLGIDSDNDGIRDDVQRWIQFDSKDNSVKRKYLRTIALVYEENFRNLTTLPNVLNNFSKLNKLRQCLKLVEQDLAKVDQMASIFKIAYGNTNNRFLALNTIDASFAGQKIDVDMSDVDLKTYCEALP